MASENEPAKTLLPYLQRADELQKHEPLVAYYCRLYAMEKGLKIPQNQRTKTTNALLVSLMNQLEKDRKSLKLGPDDNLHVEGFALNVFAKADKQDRAGRADLGTAKTFYAASIFFEILNQFGPLQPDLEQKQKYAVWKAADIRKAIKEGRKPVPGPPGGDDDLSVPSSTPGSGYDLGPNETVGGTFPGAESQPTPKFGDNISRQNSASIPPSSHIHDKADDDHSASIPPPMHFHDNFSDQHSMSTPRTSQFHDKVNDEHATNIPPHSHPSAGYNSQDFHPPPPPANRTETPPYSQQYHHQSYPQEPPHHFAQNYPQEPQQHLPQNYPPSETPSLYSYPNFQSYPSLSESSLPSAPSHYPYYQGPETTYSPHSNPAATSRPPADQYASSNRNGSVSDPVPAPAKVYEYDSNYQPPPEKIAEAHKAARFAVGALAFDDVSVAVDYLKKSLELLTNPSASN